MKIERLIGILSVLLQKEKVTAPYLAEKFEVSRRTINRDIEHLCQAGIPVVTIQGQNGGISIMEGYRMDRTLLTSSDMQAILSGLQSLDSVSGTNRYQQLMDKLQAESSDRFISSQHISIDLSSWYKTSLAPKIDMLRQAIERREQICFEYYAPKGESRREIEPYRLIFKWSSWYVWGYCMDKNDFRMFKLNRMVDVTYSGKTFKERNLPFFEIKNEDIYPNQFQVKALFSPTVKWRLVDEYGMDSFQEMPDGKLLFCFEFSDKQELYRWLLTFEDEAELLEPEMMRRDFGRMIKKMGKIYE